MLQYIIDHYDHDFTLLQSFLPEALHFTMNDEDESTIEYQISSAALDLDGDPVITGDDFLSPHNTHWRLRYGGNVIMGGIHTRVEMDYGANYMSVAGSDWLWYFNQRFMPFDGRVGHVNDYIIGTPPEGLAYEKLSVDIATALTDILDQILGRTNSLPITYSLSSTGVVMDYYRLDLADTTTLMDIVKSICGYNPGRAFEITPGRVFQISDDERWYGTQADLADGDDTNAALIWVVNADHPPLACTFRNTGPMYTHIQGEGAGTTARYVTSLGNTANQEAYWRTDGNEQFENAITRDETDAQTHEQFAFALNPVHEIPLSLDPDQVDKQYSVDQGHDPGDDDGYFWTIFKPGRAIWVDLQFIAHHIDSAQQIVSIDATVVDNGVTECKIALNQIYDNTGYAHTAEG